MSAYFIANIRIHDHAEYEKYLSHTDEVFSKFKGKYLAVDENPEVLEGKWSYSRLVLIEFPDKQALKDWYCSVSYQEILKHRLKSADCCSIIVG